jgi:hypothetical protein
LVQRRGAAAWALPQVHRLLGRDCGWKETSAFCGKCHACFGRHEWLENIEAAERRLRPVPYLTSFPGFSRWTSLRVLWRDKRRCKGCRSKKDLHLHRRVPEKVASSAFRHQG